MLRAISCTEDLKKKMQAKVSLQYLMAVLCTNTSTVHGLRLQCCELEYEAIRVQSSSTCQSSIARTRFSKSPDFLSPGLGSPLLLSGRPSARRPLPPRQRHRRDEEEAGRIGKRGAHDSAAVAAGAVAAAAWVAWKYIERP